MTDSIRPVDQARACRVALGVLDGNDKAIVEVLDEAHAEDALLAVLASATQSWLAASIAFAGEAQTRDALQSAIFDADLASDD